MRLFEILTYVGAAFGALLVLMVLTSARGAPQEAAGAAMALAFTAIPYCVASLLLKREMLRRLRDRG